MIFLLKFLVSDFICQIQHCFRISKTNCPEVERATNSNFRDEEILMPANALNKAECQYGQRSLKTISCVCFYTIFQFLHFKFLSNHYFNGFCFHILLTFTFFSFFFFTCYYIVSYCTLSFISNGNVLAYEIRSTQNTSKKHMYIYSRL